MLSVDEDGWSTSNGSLSRVAGITRSACCVVGLGDDARVLETAREGRGGGEGGGVVRKRGRKKHNGGRNDTRLFFGDEILTFFFHGLVICI